MKRVCLISTATGCGKSTIGRALAERMKVELARFPLAGLRSTADVDGFLRSVEPETSTRQPTPRP